MLFNDILILEIFLFIILVFYILNTNLLILLYTGFLYLLLLGSLSLINDADIYIGFLWIIDLGVGLVFFIFILHFTSFLFQKSYLNLSIRYFFIFILLVIFIIIFFYFNVNIVDLTFNYNLWKTWFYKISYIDYYIIHYSYEITDLNTIRDTYFLLNSLEFFIINFSLLFGLLISILLYFLIQRIFNYLNFSQISSFKVLNNNSSGFIVRNQNFILQQLSYSNINQYSKVK